MSPGDMMAFREKLGMPGGVDDEDEDEDYDFGDYMDESESEDYDSQASDSEDDEELGLSTDDPRSSVVIEELTEVLTCLAANCEHCAASTLQLNRSQDSLPSCLLTCEPCMQGLVLPQGALTNGTSSHGAADSRAAIKAKARAAIKAELEATAARQPAAASGLGLQRLSAAEAEAAAAHSGS